jgi:hypothetical protein
VTVGGAAGASAAARPARRYALLWGAAFAVVFAALLWSTCRFAGMDVLPSRFLDPAGTTLSPGPEGQVLRLVIRDVPTTAALGVARRTRADGGLDVVLRWEEGADLSGPRAPRTIDVPVPDAPEVRVLDERFGRVEGLTVRRAGRAP